MAGRQPIRGVTAPTPRPTPWAWIYAIVFVALPFIGILLLADAGLYLFFKYVLGRCYGVFCLF